MSVSFKKLCQFVTASIIFKECLKYKNLQNKKEKFLITTIQFNFRIDIVVVPKNFVKKETLIRDLGEAGLMPYTQKLKQTLVKLLLGTLARVALCHMEEMQSCPSPLI